MKSLCLLVLFIAAALAEYECEICIQNKMCCNIPEDNQYYLTTFCKNYPHAQMSCGDFCDDGNVWFTADRQRFGCHSYVTVCNDEECVAGKVLDAGPAWWVETNASMPVLDASPAFCQKLFGHQQCGWSDELVVTVTVNDYEDMNDDLLGPMVGVTREEIVQIKKGMITPAHVYRRLLRK